MEKNENKIVDVIATSDMHSHFLNGDYGSNIYRAGTYVNEARKNNENVILLDSGGSLAGSLAAFYYAVVAPYKRHPMIKLMNAMQYDASGISPNEFKFGLSFLTRSVALSRFPWLSANIEYTVTREPYFSTPYTIKMYSDLKIAIVGLTSDGLMKNEYAEMEEDVCIEKTLVSAKRWIRYIHEVEEPDFLIVIYHGGLNKISSANKRNEKNANEAEKIMEELGVIDVIITAHQHQTVVGKDHGTIYVQAGQNAEELVNLSIKFKKRTTSYEIEHIDSKVIDLNDYHEDEQLLKETYYDRKAVKHWANSVVSNKNNGLTVQCIEDIICKPHPFTQLLHDAIRLAYNYDISCVHIPKNGEEGLKGTIRNRDIYDAYPHPDKPIDITVKGKNIKDILEYSYAHIDFNKRQLSMTMIDETLFTVWQGFDYCIDMSQSPFNRVKLNGLNEEDSYRITMTDYCYRNYKMYLQEAIVHDTYSETMGGLIRKNLKCDMYSVKLNHNFKVY